MFLNARLINFAHSIIILRIYNYCLFWSLNLHSAQLFGGLPCKDKSTLTLWIRSIDLVLLSLSTTDKVYRLGLAMSGSMKTQTLAMGTLLTI